MRIPEGLNRLLQASAIEIMESRQIDHGTQYILSRGTEVATLNLYNSGNASVGGKASGLRTVLEDWKRESASNPASIKRGSKPPVALGASRPVMDVTPRVGADESGKGDYFGPLVVAGVRILGEEAARELHRIEVRDSKTLSVQQAAGLAREVLDTVGGENVHVVVLQPGEYEARRSAAGDLNKLLGELNGEIINKLKDEVEAFIVDEFGRSARSYIEPLVPPGVRLEVRPRAEDDAAVAAASILARARFLLELRELSRKVGVELPRGSTHVIGAAQRIVQLHGPEGLAGVAKMHFRTTAKVLGGI